MDRPDEEFENYLRQFQLRRPGPLSEQIQARSGRNSLRVARWAVAAAVVLAVTLTSFAIVRVFRVPTGPFVRIENSEKRIEAGQTVRSDSSQGLVLTLDDASKIEMSSESELSVDAAEDGARIHLNRGSIIVDAAKQKSGHLYVKTPNATVSVMGTVSMVETDSVGTRVAVMLGEASVDQGGKRDTLRSGEQIATSPSMPLKSIRDRILWSRNLVAYLTMLPQATVAEIPLPSVTSAPRQKEDPASVPSLPPLPPLPEDATAGVNPPAVPSGGDKVEMACGSCHSASVAYSIAPNVDTTALERQRIEVAANLKQMRQRYGDAYPAIQSAEAALKQLEEQLASPKASVSAYVSKHYRGPGVSDQDLSAVVEAILRSWSAVPAPTGPKKRFQ